MASTRFHRLQFLESISWSVKLVTKLNQHLHWNKPDPWRNKVLSYQIWLIKIDKRVKLALKAFDFPFINIDALMDINDGEIHFHFSPQKLLTAKKTFSLKLYFFSHIVAQFSRFSTESFNFWCRYNGKNDLEKVFYKSMNFLLVPSCSFFMASKTFVCEVKCFGVRSVWAEWLWKNDGSWRFSTLSQQPISCRDEDEDEKKGLKAMMNTKCFIFSFTVVDDDVSLAFLWETLEHLPQHVSFQKSHYEPQ